MVQHFRGTFKDASSDEEIRLKFMIEEVLLELDTKLEDFVLTRIEVSNYGKLVKSKYGDLDLLETTQVMEIIKKFKGKHPDIILV